MNCINLIDLAPDKPVNFRYKSGDDKSFFLKGLNWQAVESIEMTIKTRGGVVKHTLKLNDGISYNAGLDAFVFDVSRVWATLPADTYRQDCVARIAGLDRSLWQVGNFDVIKTITSLPEQNPAFMITMPTGEIITVPDPITGFESILTFSS